MEGGAPCRKCCLFSLFQSDTFCARSLGFLPWGFLSLLEFLPEAAWSSASPYLQSWNRSHCLGWQQLSQHLLECEGECKRAVSCHQAAKCSCRFPGARLKDCVHAHVCWGDSAPCRVFRAMAHKCGMFCAQASPQASLGLYPDI